MKTNRQMNGYVGAAGVHAVASRLFLAGHVAYFPGFDIGTDIVIDNGLKIQVKCGRYKKDINTSGKYYTLNLDKVSKYRDGRIVNEPRGYEEIVDFVIFWAIEENRFFVFPASRVKKSVYIPSNVSSHLRTSKTCDSAKMVAEFEEAWHLLDVDAVAEAVVEAQVLEGV